MGENSLRQLPIDIVIDRLRAKIYVHITTMLSVPVIPPVLSRWPFKRQLF